MIPIIGICQTDSIKSNRKEIFTIIEEQPSFPGSKDALSKYISSEQRRFNYTKDDPDKGTVYLTFHIDTHGTITNPKVIRGVNARLDSLAIEIVKGMPNWTPGKFRNKNIDVDFNMPITFGVDLKSKK